MSARDFWTLAGVGIVLTGAFTLMGNVADPAIVGLGLLLAGMGAVMILVTDRIAGRRERRAKKRGDAR